MVWFFLIFTLNLFPFFGTRSNVKTRLLKLKLRIQLKLWNLKRQQFLEAFPKPEEKHFQFSISQKKKTEF